VLALIYVLLIKKERLKVNRSQFTVLVYIAIAGTLFADFLYFYALTTIPVINAVLLGHLQPIFIIILAFFLLKTDAPGIYDYIGIGIMMISALLVTTKTVENALSLTFGSIGDIVVLLATFAWASAAIIMRKYLRSIDAGIITFYRFFLASWFFAFLLITDIPTAITIYQVGVGVVVAIGTICYYEGLKRLKAAQVSGLELSAPVFASAIGFFVLAETITGMQLIGIALLFLGIYFLSKKELIA
jgi:drug/metabolite transporter (DMT)-like permease